MTVARVASNPDLTSTGSYYIPTYFAGKTLVKYYSNAVVPNISNTDYEGEIKSAGDTVVIRTVPTVTVSNYVKGQTLQYEDLESADVQLAIDKAKSYAFKVDDVDKKQSDIIMSDKFTSDASRQMEISIDTDILADIPSDASAYNQGLTAGKNTSSYNLGVSGTPLALTKANVTDWLVDMKSVLTEQDVPDDGKSRWLTLPPSICGLIDKSDLKNASFSGEDKSRMYKGGYIGSLAGFNIHESNLLNTTSDGGNTVHDVLFGHMDALTFAMQLVDNKMLTLESTYGEGFRGLNVYGYKVVKPEALGWSYVYAS